MCKSHCSQFKSSAITSSLSKLHPFKFIRDYTCITRWMKALSLLLYKAQEILKGFKTAPSQLALTIDVN